MINEFIQQKKASLGDILNSIISGNKFISRWAVIDAKTKNDICSFDSFKEYDVRDTSSIPTVSIEEGGFANYNKINNAKEFTVSLIKSGSSLALNEMVDKLESYKSSTNLVNIILPFRTYLNCNIRDMSHSIKSGGAVNTLIVELKLLEINEEQSSYYTSTELSASKVKTPADASTEKKGVVQSLLFKGENAVKNALT